MDFWTRVSRNIWIPGAAAGVFLLGIGAALGQFDTIWNKAVMICLECIGLG